MLRSEQPALAREFHLLPHHLDALTRAEARYFAESLAASYDPPTEASKEQIEMARRQAAARVRAKVRYLAGS